MPEEVCCECGGAFTADEWENRHTGYKGGDCHARCCPICRMRDMRRGWVYAAAKKGHSARRVKV